MKTHDQKLFKCFSRKYQIGEVEPPAFVKLIFAKYSGGGTHIGTAQLRRFLAEVQGEKDCTLTDAGRIIDEVASWRQTRSDSTGHCPPALSLDDFFHYLLSDDINQVIRTQVHHDMTAPLSHYFIYTGHNSYLTGNQLSSDCSVVPIIKALQGGVRVIELDIWPNSSKDDVDVLHGRTLTAPVTLIECLKSIKENAFVASPYPVIITLEDHLTPDLQAKTAEMITQTFGDILYYPESGALEEFPSPESLKYRIIISTKVPKKDAESRNVKRKENSSEKEGDIGEDTSRNEVSYLLAELEDESKSESEEEEENKDSREGREEQSEAPNYKHLITIQAGKPVGGLRKALSTTESKKIRRLSLSEQALEKAATSHGADLVRFTQKNILRIYPKGTRVNSSNYKPMLGWMHGAQMVAFNMQGYGKSLCLMQGMFRCNGGCGYIKKPDFLMMRGPRGEVFDPKRTIPVKRILKVEVHMGDGWSSDFSPKHFDTYSPPDFYIKLQIKGVPGDDTKRKTKIIDDNWFPVWEEAFIFSLIVPELALLRIEVREHDRSDKDDFAGQTCIPIPELRPGIRSVPLFDKKGEKYRSVRLLMQFEFL